MTLTLEAHSEEHNHHRKYEIVVGRDLLNDWTVAVRYGRVGRCGQEKCYATKDEQEIRAIIRDKLQRRLSAPKRIGCSYQIVELDSAKGIRAERWLPVDEMARLFQGAVSDSLS